MPDRSGPAFVGVDGGGTKTRAVVLDARGKVLGRGTGGPANASTQPAGRLRTSVVTALTGALAEAGVALKGVAHAVLGLAGVESEEARRRATEPLTEVLGGTPFTLTTDGRIALAAAADDPERGAAVVLVSGTGAIAHGRNAQGREARASGMGWILGDEGSGFWIARRGLEAVARALDGRAAPTAIAGVLERRHGVKTAEDLVAAVYRSGVLPAGVAAFAPAVFEAAAEGDVVARGIVDEGASELALAALTVVRELGLSSAEFPMVLSGGNLTRGGLLFEHTRERILRGAPRARVSPPVRSPEEGAARLAIVKIMGAIGA